MITFINIYLQNGDKTENLAILLYEKFICLTQNNLCPNKKFLSTHEKQMVEKKRSDKI